MVSRQITVVLLGGNRNSGVFRRFRSNSGFLSYDQKEVPVKKIHFSRRSRVFANSEGREKRGKGGEKEGKEEKREGRRITVAVKLMMVLMRYL